MGVLRDGKMAKLVKQLKHKNSAKVKKAIHALVKINAAEAINDMLDIVKESNDEIRDEVKKGLTKMQTLSRWYLITNLPDGELHDFIVEALKEMELSENLKMFWECLSHTENLKVFKEGKYSLEETQFAVLQAICVMGEIAAPVITQIWNEGEKETRFLLERLFRKNGIESVPILMHQLNLGSYFAVNLLKEIGEKSITPELLRIVSEEKVRKYSIEILIHFKEPQVAPILINQLESDDINEITQAIDGITKLKIQTAIPALKGLLNKEESKIREMSAKALFCLKPEKVDTALQAYFYILENEPLKCMELGKDSVIPLITMLHAEYSLTDIHRYETMSQIAEVLGNLGDKRAVSPLIKFFKKDFSPSAAEALGKLKAVKARRVLENALDGQIKYPNDSRGEDAYYKALERIRAALEKIPKYRRS